MIFRRNKAERVSAEELDEEPLDEATVDDDAEDRDDEPDAVDTDEDADAADDETGEADGEDWRADGPFDIDEVDLEGDTVPRIDLGALVVTPIPGIDLGLQLDADKRVLGVLMEWGPEQPQGAPSRASQFEVVLYAAPASGGVAEELLEDTVEEARDADGQAEAEEGIFGQQVRRVIPIGGQRRQQAYHSSVIWFAEGPRWALRGTLMGAAAEPKAEESLAKPFVQFFRNLIVRRGDETFAPGTIIPLTMPKMS